MNEANLVRQMRASRPKEGVSKGKTTPTPEGLVSTLFGSYDYKNQRIYTDMPGINPWNGQKFYYWNQSGAIIGEGKVGVNDYVARYFYSGNQKIAMERYDQTSGTSSFYYFINNAQGTPVLIVDEQNNAISKINLDEWGNVGDKTTGPRQEINYTGKKMDIPTRLYYFNQRYYDPEIGRFVNEDPAKQLLNLYQYCGNNPLMYTDPTGQIFGWDDAIWAVASYLAAEGAKTAAVNAFVQYVGNGCNVQKINWNAVGQSFVKGAIGAGIGEMEWVKPGGSDWLSYGIAGAANGAINGGLTNVAYGMVSGQNMSLENTWNQFGAGAGPGAIAGFCKGVYKYETKFSKVDSGPGLKGAYPNKFKSEYAAVEGYNNIGFGEGEGEGSWKDILREGGKSWASPIFNYAVPGFNAFAALHDCFANNYGWIDFETFIPNAALAIPITYGALSMPGRY